MSIFFSSSDAQTVVKKNASASGNGIVKHTFTSGESIVTNSGTTGPSDGMVKETSTSGQSMQCSSNAPPQR